MEWLSQPWPWYVAGPLIGLTVPVLLILGNKSFGISASMRHLCAACVPAGIPFFKYDWKKEIWNLVFVVGVVLGGIIAATVLSTDDAILIHPELQKELSEYGITTLSSSLVPEQLFQWQMIFSIKGFILLVVGGFLVGFGSRYAGGCTSGHAIMGLSNLQVSSLFATCCFMIGGIIMANFILPYILLL